MIQETEYNKMANRVWFEKYALKNKEGELLEENLSDTFKRVAIEFAKIEKTKFKNPLSFETIFEQFNTGKIIPNGRPLMGIGNHYSNVTLSNCFIVPKPQDNYGSIIKTDENIVQISKRGGGIGFAIENLRPDGYAVNNAAISSTGMVSFMDRYSNSINEVSQKGRRGALMLCCDVSHPDIKGFINSKIDHNKITGANISIKTNREFMEGVIDYEENGNDRMFVSRFNDEKIEKYKISELWNNIIENNLKHAEPGILFWDIIEDEAIQNCYGDKYKVLSTNPCGEIVGGAYSTCRLITINLFAFVRDIETVPYFDFDEFNETIQIATRLNDDLIDLDIISIENIIEKIKNDVTEDDVKQREVKLWENVIDIAKEIRQSGLGITALGDLFAGLRLRYGSEESLVLTDKIMKMLRDVAYTVSIEMAKEIGSFLVFDFEKEKGNPYLNRLYSDNPHLKEEMKKYGRRNINILTCPPCGTISLITGVTSGIEPIFMKEYKRKRKVFNHSTNKDEWEEFTVKHPVLEKYDFLDEYYVTSHELNPLDKVKVLSIIQKYVDNSISSTTNMPKETTTKQISDIMISSYKNRLKGITIYVDCSRDGVLKKVENDNLEKWKSGVIKRPKKIDCEILFKKFKGVKFAIAIGILQNKPYEIFVLSNDFIDRLPTDINNLKPEILKVKSGVYNIVFYSEKENKTIEVPLTNTDKNSDEIDGLTRMMSTLLRHNIDINTITTQLEKVRGFDNFSKTYGRMLKKWIEDGTVINGVSCPDCSSKLVRRDGCWECFGGCGYSVCK